MPSSQWSVLESAPSEFGEVCGDLGVADARARRIILDLLWQRGIRTPDEVTAFLNPSYEAGVHDPALFSHMERAVARVFAALEGNERVLVFGDYDADGLTGSTIILSTLREIAARLGSSADITSYIPHRDREGYGLRMVQAERFAEEGVRLVVTVDCGIACPAEIAYLRGQGVDTIVVDHHRFGDELPDGILIHPSIPGETYPFKHLAAAGVAWKLASGLIRAAREKGLAVSEGFEKWLLDLVAIATITDLVPLVGENRVLETYGLRVLNKMRRPGIRALAKSAGVHRNVGSRDVGFMIGPRLNAPSRMAHASIGLDLLTADADERAALLAADIEKLNRARQDATTVMAREADALAAEHTEAPIRVIWKKEWSPALVGLVAGRLADRVGVPVIAIGNCEGTWIGSGRSVPAYDITEAVKRAGEGLLLRAGGHVQACGFALGKDEDVPVFAERLRRDASERLSFTALEAPFEIHSEIALSDIDWPLVAAVGRLEPFGQGNTEPRFLTRDLNVVGVSAVGKEGAHLRMVCRSEGGMRPFIGFGLGNRVGEVARGSRIDIVYAIGEEERDGRRDVRCRMIDFRVH